MSKNSSQTKSNTKKTQKERTSTINKHDDDGYAPLHRAILGNPDTTNHMNELIKQGASINKPDIDGNTPLHLAILKGDMNKVSLILSHNPNMSVRNKDKNTPLHLAIMKENIDFVNTLLKYPQDFSLKNEEKNTPLHIAIMKENIELVNTLLKYPQRFSLKNEEGNTPLHIAVMKMNLDLIYILLRKGACNTIKKPNQNGITPLSIAENYDDPELRKAAVTIMTNMCEGPMAAGGSKRKTRKNVSRKNKTQRTHS